MIIKNCQENNQNCTEIETGTNPNDNTQPDQVVELEEIASELPEQNGPTEKTITDVIVSVSEISTQVSVLQEQLHKHVLTNKDKDEAFDRLYAELETYKKNSAFDQVRPLFMDLILMFDRISNLTEDAEKRDDKYCAEVLKTVTDELVEIMYRRDIDIITSIQETFDPTTQRAIGVDRIESEEENNKISRIVRKGFRCGDRLLRPEEVIVKKYSPRRPDDQVNTAE